VKGRDGPSEGFALVDQPIAGVAGRLRLDEGDEVLDAGLCGRSRVACSHDRDTNLAELAGIINGRAVTDDRA
jgi:hypothetical protein